MKDLQLKQQIVVNETDKLVRQLHWRQFQTAYNGVLFDDMEPILADFSKLDNDTLRVCNNLNKSRYRRISKAKKFILNHIFNPSFFEGLNVAFITFTFNDETLKSTTETARRKRIRLILDNNCYNYIANIDFGKDNEREHYHAVALLKENADFSKAEKNGFFYVEPVKVNDVSSERLSRYLNKLVYHALKDTTQHENSSYRAIYKTTLSNI